MQVPVPLTASTPPPWAVSLVRVQVTSVVVDSVGETSVASTVSYVDNGFVFVGSVFSDSQLVKLQDVADEVTGSYVKV